MRSSLIASGGHTGNPQCQSDRSRCARAAFGARSLRHRACGRAARCPTLRSAHARAASTNRRAPPPMPRRSTGQ
jgi:hypothetical protein